jgi:chromosome segregation ATPase
MLRFIDKQHRRVLHARDKEMEKLRERLAEVDTVYRQQLKERDFKIEDLKKRLDHKRDSLEAKLEKARNEVEDVWERRWKDRDFHLRERMSRIESQAGRDLPRSRENLTGHDEDED